LLKTIIEEDKWMTVSFERNLFISFRLANCTDESFSL